jgi:hypothetical protein
MPYRKEYPLDENGEPEGGARLAAESITPEDMIRGPKAVVILEKALAQIGLPALAFLPIHQPERELGLPIWRLTAIGGKDVRGLTIPEATLADTTALDAFLRRHVKGEA